VIESLGILGELQRTKEPQATHFRNTSIVPSENILDLAWTPHSTREYFGVNFPVPRPPERSDLSAVTLCEGKSWPQCPRSLKAVFASPIAWAYTVAQVAELKLLWSEPFSSFQSTSRLSNDLRLIKF